MRLNNLLNDKTSVPLTPETAGPKTGHKCQVSGHRSQNSGPTSQVLGHGSKVTSHKQREISFFEIKRLLAFVDTVDELKLKLFNFLVDS